MTPEMILAISSLVTALLAGLGAWRSAQIASNAARLAARKDEVVLLREEVARLHQRVKELEKENEWLRGENIALRKEVAWLESVLLQHGIKIPKMPSGWAKED